MRTARAESVHTDQKLYCLQYVFRLYSGSPTYTIHYLNNSPEFCCGHLSLLKSATFIEIGCQRISIRFPPDFFTNSLILNKLSTLATNRVNQSG